MKNVLGLTAALSCALFAQTAVAAPLSGAYVGVEGSHDSYELKAQGTNLGGTSISFDGLSGNGVSGGVYAGYDLPIMPSAFIGVEAGFDYSGAAISASATSGGNSLAGSVKARETYSVAARLGFKPAASTGVYAKLGYANTRFKTQAFSNGTEVFSDSRSKGAFVYGGGIETALTDRVAIRGEFTVADFGSAGLNAALGVNGIKLSNSKTSVGVSYRF